MQRNHPPLNHLHSNTLLSSYHRLFVLQVTLTVYYLSYVLFLYAPYLYGQPQTSQTNQANTPPASVIFSQNFTDLQAIDSSIIVDMRYFSNNNFIGTQIDGYQANRCLLTKNAALALKKVQDQLKTMALSLKVYDCYRPQRAVDHFVRWQKQINNYAMKAHYYPDLDKKQLFDLGYIAYKSGHSRGSTIDLTIEGLDMGSPWDFFGPISHTHSPKITIAQKAHRLLLKTLMESHGFTNYHKEWWHFTLRNESFPTTFFDVVIR